MNKVFLATVLFIASLSPLCRAEDDFGWGTILAEKKFAPQTFSFHQNADPHHLRIEDYSADLKVLVANTEGAIYNPFFPQVFSANTFFFFTRDNSVIKETQDLLRNAGEFEIEVDVWITKSLILNDRVPSPFCYVSYYVQYTPRLPLLKLQGGAEVLGYNESVRAKIPVQDCDVLKRDNSF